MSAKEPLDVWQRKRRSDAAARDDPRVSVAANASNAAASVSESDKNVTESSNAASSSGSGTSSDDAHGEASNTSSDDEARSSSEQGGTSQSSEQGDEGDESPASEQDDDEEDRQISSAKASTAKQADTANLKRPADDRTDTAKRRKSAPKPPQPQFNYEKQSMSLSQPLTRTEQASSKASAKAQDDEEAALAARRKALRAYNREHAEKSRKRRKQRLESLTSNVQREAAKQVLYREQNMQLSQSVNQALQDIMQYADPAADETSGHRIAPANAAAVPNYAASYQQVQRRQEHQLASAVSSGNVPSLQLTAALAGTNADASLNAMDPSVVLQFLAALNEMNQQNQQG